MNWVVCIFNRLARICELALRRCASKRWVPYRDVDGM